MKKYYFTFSSNHFYDGRERLDKHWVEVLAESARAARRIFIEKFAEPKMGGAEEWSWQYDSEEWEAKEYAQYFPLGRFATITSTST